MRTSDVVLGAVLCLGFCAISSSAHDEPAGSTAKTRVSIDFQKTPHENFSPALFSWDEAAQARLTERLNRALSRFPLDLEGFGSLHVVISNASAVCAPDNDVYLEEIEPPPLDERQRRRMVCNARCGQDNGFWLGSNTMAISGSLLVEFEENVFDGLLLHELVHGWQTLHAAELQSFLKIRYNKLSKPWEKLTGHHLRWYARRNPYQDPCAYPNEDRKTIQDIERAMYKNMRLPWRRYLPGSRVDMHSMKNPEEYLAVLAEILFVDPDWAGAQFSAEEIAWVRAHVFKQASAVARGSLERSHGRARSLADGLALALGAQ